MVASRGSLSAISVMMFHSSSTMWEVPMLNGKPRAAYIAAEWLSVADNEWRIAVFVITSNVIVLWLFVRSRENTAVARIGIAFQPSTKGDDLSYILGQMLTYPTI